MRNLNTPPTLADIMIRYRDADPEHVLLDDHDTAGCLDQSRKTLETWRREGREIPFIKLGRRVRYRLADILAYLDAHTYASTRAAKTRTPAQPQHRKVPAAATRYTAGS